MPSISFTQPVSQGNNQIGGRRDERNHSVLVHRSQDTVCSHPFLSSLNNSPCPHLRPRRDRKRFFFRRASRLASRLAPLLFDSATLCGRTGKKWVALFAIMEGRHLTKRRVVMNKDWVCTFLVVNQNRWHMPGKQCFNTHCFVGPVFTEADAVYTDTLAFHLRLHRWVGNNPAVHFFKHVVYFWELVARYVGSAMRLSDTTSTSL